MRQVKCPKCGVSNNKEDTIKYNNRYYCPTCLDDYQQDSESYKNLITYICDLYQVKSPPMLIVKQIKDFKDTDKYNFTNVGIQYTLQYYYHILGNGVNTDMGIGIVPYYYDKAKLYYNDKFMLEDAIMDFVTNEKIICSKPSKTSTKDRYKPLDYDIDWSDKDFEE